MNKIMFDEQMKIFISNNKNLRPEFEEYYTFPCLEDDTYKTNYDTHYIYHLAWATRKVLNAKPKLHVDISSSLNFSTTISSVVPTLFFDYRPAEIYMDNLTCMAGDLTNENEWKERVYDSVSCMHVIEHIGLGRYGDKLDVMSDITALANLKKIIAKRGKLLLVVPVGKPAIYFNAHRVYSAQNINNFFIKDFELKEFYFIPGPVELKPIINCDFKFTEKFNYGCGCFEYIRK